MLHQLKHLKPYSPICHIAVPIQSYAAIIVVFIQWAKLYDIDDTERHVAGRERLDLLFGQNVWVTGIDRDRHETY